MWDWGRGDFMGCGEWEILGALSIGEGEILGMGKGRYFRNSGKEEI